MKILLSAYACEPGKGSEPGVGWNWALELARQGHEVTVLTRANNRPNIEPAMAHEPRVNLQFVYYDLPHWAKAWKKGGRGVRLYHLLWQAGMYRLVRRTMNVDAFDIVHHLTFGGLRQASFLGRLGRPFLFGPIGGGETAPPRLRKTFPFARRIRESIRDISSKLSTFDPSVRQTLHHAQLIYCKTAQTLEVLPHKYHARSKIALEVGIEPRWLAEAINVPVSPEFVSVGRLLYWKGTHLTLEAFALVLSRRSDARLKVIGVGPDEQWLKAKAAKLKIGHAVEWLGWQPQEKVRIAYRDALAMVFPSLHDSSGNVALEAMASGTPVICLDVGGPATIVPESAGFHVDTRDAEPEAVVARIADAMLALAGDRELAAAMSMRALEFARTRTWKTAVDGIYGPILAEMIAPHSDTEAT